MQFYKWDLETSRLNVKIWRKMAVNKKANAQQPQEYSQDFSASPALLQIHLRNIFWTTMWSFMCRFQIQTKYQHLPSVTKAAQRRQVSGYYAVYFVLSTLRSDSTLNTDSLCAILFPAQIKGLINSFAVWYGTFTSLNLSRLFLHKRARPGSKAPPLGSGALH